MNNNNKATAKKSGKENIITTKCSKFFHLIVFCAFHVHNFNFSEYGPNFQDQEPTLAQFFNKNIF